MKKDNKNIEKYIIPDNYPLSEETIERIHQIFQEVLIKGGKIPEIIMNLYSSVNQIVTEMKNNQDINTKEYKVLEEFLGILKNEHELRFQKTFSCLNFLEYLSITMLSMTRFLSDKLSIEFNVDILSRIKSLRSSMKKLMKSATKGEILPIYDFIGIKIILDDDNLSKEKSISQLYTLHENLLALIYKTDLELLEEYQQWISEKSGFNYMDRAVPKLFLQCYSIKAFTERDKDYITNPKENGYSALHNTCSITATSRCLPGHFFEIQFSTKSMDFNNEYGTASHDNVYKKDNTPQTYMFKIDHENINKINSSELILDIDKHNNLTILKDSLGIVDCRRCVDRKCSPDTMPTREDVLLIV